MCITKVDYFTTCQHEMLRRIYMCKEWKDGTWIDPRRFPLAPNPHFEHECITRREGLCINCIRRAALRPSVVIPNVEKLIKVEEGFEGGGRETAKKRKLDHESKPQPAIDWLDGTSFNAQARACGIDVVTAQHGPPPAPGSSNVKEEDKDSLSPTEIKSAEAAAVEVLEGLAAQKARERMGSISKTRTYSSDSEEEKGAGA